MKAADVLAVEQRTEAWLEARVGRLTGSSAEAVIAVRKRGTGELAIRRDTRKRLVVERLTGLPQDDLKPFTKAMQHGVDTEAAAFRAYEAATGQLVKRVGFIAHRTLQAGASPDGYIGEFVGIIELKCPNSATHLDYFRSEAVPEEYLPQIIHNLWLTGAEWCDFVSFDDRFPPSLRMCRRRVHRADVDLVAYELAAVLFLNEVDQECQAVLRLAAAGVAA